MRTAVLKFVPVLVVPFLTSSALSIPQRILPVGNYEFQVVDGSTKNKKVGSLRVQSSDLGPKIELKVGNQTIRLLYDRESKQVLAQGIVATKPGVPAQSTIGNLRFKGQRYQGTMASTMFKKSLNLFVGTSGDTCVLDLKAQKSLNGEAHLTADWVGQFECGYPNRPRNKASPKLAYKELIPKSFDKPSLRQASLDVIKHNAFRLQNCVDLWLNGEVTYHQRARATSDSLGYEVAIVDRRIKVLKTMTSPFRNSSVDSCIVRTLKQLKMPKETAKSAENMSLAFYINCQFDQEKGSKSTHRSCQLSLLSH